ncbi:MAG TPA: ATP-binding protein, partial [Polyangiaceae bacterium]
NRLLWVPMLAVVGLAQAVLLATVGLSQPTRFIPGMTWVVALCLARWVAHRRSALVALKVVAGGLLASTTFAVLAHSVHAPAFWSNILALAVIVPLYGARAGILLSLWCALCGAAWFALHRLGWGVSLVYPPSLFTYTFMLGCMFCGIGLMSIPTALLAAALRASEQRRLEAVQARQAEQNAELALRAVFEQTGAVTALVKPDGTILRLNPMAERLMGVEVGDFINRKLSDLPWVGAQTAERIESALQRAVHGIERLDAVVVGAAGQRHLQLAIAPINGLDGTLRSLVVEGLDATRLIEVERELSHASRLEALGQLAGGVAHDFNNMLFAMHGALESLQSTRLGAEERVESMETISQAVVRASDLTRKLLAFGRRDRFETQVVDLEILISEASNIFRRTLCAPIELRLELASERTLVNGDASAIEHALVNLMVNARDAMTSNGMVSGTITLRTRVIAVEEARCAAQSFPISEGRIVELSITDDGVGMTEEVRARAFEPFFTTKPVGQGTGLGLAAVHGTMLSHGGGVGVESQEGNGTTVFLYFPLVTSAVTSRVPPSGVGFTVQLNGTVLVVDDEPLSLRVTRRYLNALGVTAVFVGDGVAALELIESGTQFDCVLTDIVMPKMSGPALVAELRRKCPELPVVIMSGFPGGSEGSMNDALSDCPRLRKPFGRSDLARTLAPILTRSSEARVGKQ